jgi:hypothetical protein
MSSTLEGGQDTLSSFIFYYCVIARRFLCYLTNRALIREQMSGELVPSTVNLYIKRLLPDLLRALTY